MFNANNVTVKIEEGKYLLWYKSPIDPANAKVSFEQAIQESPDPLVEAYYSLGVADYRLGNKTEPIKNARKALAIKSDYAPANDFLHEIGGG